MEGDEYQWLTFNTRLANELGANFEMQYEASWQVMDLQTEGFEGRGDVDAVLSQAHLVLKERFEVPRLSAVPMEGRAVVCSYDAGEKIITLWTCLLYTSDAADE